jgi:hypothetical protein
MAQDFSWQRFARQYAQLYCDLAGQRRSLAENRG